MNDAQAAPGASLIPDSTDIFTITVFVLIALFALGAIAIIVIGSRRKRRRVAAAAVVQERIEQEAPTPPEAPREPAPTAAAQEPVATTASPAEAPAAPDVAPVPSADDPAQGPVTQLKGLGPKVAARLAELGITTIGDLAALSDVDAARMDADLGAFAGRMARDRWVEQARLLAADDRAGFEAVFGKL